MTINIYREEIVEDPKEAFLRILYMQGYREITPRIWTKQDNRIEPIFIYDGGILRCIELRCTDLDVVGQSMLTDALEEISEHVDFNILFVTIKRLLHKEKAYANFG